MGMTKRRGIYTLTGKTAAGVFMLSAALFALPLLSYSQLTAEDKQIIEPCEANSKPGRQDPKIAAQCLEEVEAGDLYERFQTEDSDRAAIFMSDALALKDLGRQLSDPGQSPEAFAAHFPDNLAQGKGQTSPPLNRLGLGPEPEKLLSWVNRYFPGRVGFFHDAVRSWNSLGESRQKYLSGVGKDEESWRMTSLKDRQGLLKAWVPGEARKLLAIHPRSVDAKTLKSMKAGLDDMERDIDRGSDEKNKDFQTLDVRVRQLEGLMDAREELKRKIDTASPAKKAKYQKALAKMESLRDKPLDAQSDYLSSLFDNSTLRIPTSGGGSGSTVVLDMKALPGGSAGFNPGIGAVGQPVEPEPWNGKLNDRQAAAISKAVIPALKKELSGTTAGQKIIDLYSNKAKELGVTDIEAVHLEFAEPPTKGALGEWLPKRDMIVLNRKSVENWLLKKGCIPEQVSSGGKKTDELARYLAPVFVHEATHESQSFWWKQKRIPHVYNQQEEVEAFATQNVFILEKSKAVGAGYSSQIPEWETRGTLEFKRKGLVAVKNSVSRNLFYGRVASYENRAASIFNWVKRTNSILRERRLAMATDPEKETAAESKRLTDAELMQRWAQNDYSLGYGDLKSEELVRNYVSGTFKWYRVYNQKMADDDAWVRAQWARLRDPEDSMNPL
jgi:hypothetical protein